MILDAAPFSQEHLASEGQQALRHALQIIRSPKFNDIHKVQPLSVQYLLEYVWIQDTAIHERKQQS